MPFVSPKTVFLLTYIDAPAEGGKYKTPYLKLVYGQCPITGVGGKNPLLNLHHITHKKRHYLIGIIHQHINTGLGALGNYKGK